MCDKIDCIHLDHMTTCYVIILGFHTLEFVIPSCSRDMITIISVLPSSACVKMSVIRHAAVKFHVQVQDKDPETRDVMA